MVDRPFDSAYGMAVGMPAGGGIALEFLSARADGPMADRRLAAGIDSRPLLERIYANFGLASL